jgi:hypothetical protein
MKDLELGQKVVVANYHSWQRSLFTFREVTKLTATQVTLSNGKRYLLRNGDEMGTNYGTHIVKNYSTNEWMTWEEGEAGNKVIQEELDTKELVRKMQDYSWKSVSFEDLKQIDSILQKYDNNK